jgi:outer membrane protein, heavy metal efflux system
MLRIATPMLGGGVPTVRSIVSPSQSVRACAFAGAIATALAGPPAWGQQASSPSPATPPPSAPADTVTLAAALDAAWQRAVAARENEALRRRAEAEKVAAGSLWPAPPSLELGHRSDRWQRNQGERETQVGIAVPLWWPGQRAARSGSADAAAAQAQAAERVGRLQLAGELREALAVIATAQAELTQATAQAQLLRQLADDVQRRVRAGDLARADALAAEAEVLAAAASESEARQRLRAAQSRWVVLTGLRATPAPSRTEPLAAPTAAPPETTPASHPELELARQTVVLARSRVELMRASRRDAPEVSVGVRHEVPGRSQPGAGSLVVGLRVPFGNDANNRPLEAAALGELDVAQTLEQRLRERIEADVANARAALSAARTQLDAEQARARLLNERTQLIDRSFRAGESPLPELLRALSAAALADAGALRQAAALGLAQARFQQALGVLP